MLPRAMKASTNVRPSLGHADQSEAGIRPWLCWTPVPMIVIPMARMIDTKSMYPRIATSANEGGRARRNRMIADTTPNTREQAPLSVMFPKAIAPVRLCEPTKKISCSANMTPTSS